MSLFIETIRVEEDGSVPLLSYHKSRMLRTLGDLDENKMESILQDVQSQLDELIKESPTQSTKKYRILYSTSGISEAFLTSYLIRPITTLALTTIKFDYNQKSADRININSAYHDHPETDDILMIKDGLLTDTSYGNIALLDGGIWHTPEIPLLSGCRRQYLIDKGVIKPKKIRIEDLNSYSYLMIFNAMIPFGRILIPTRHLHF